MINTLVENKIGFKDLFIYNYRNANSIGEITIKSNVLFDNVWFRNCKIILDSSQTCKFKDCKFEKCSIIFSGSCFGNMIKDCYFVYTAIPKYIGGQNIIKDNIIGE